MVQTQEDWLGRYAKDYHIWKDESTDGRIIFERPLGLIESSFDTDGKDYGGRADMNALLTLEICHTLSQEQFRRRIALAWTSLRLQHVLLQSRVIQGRERRQRSFVVEIQGEVEEVVQNASESIVWLEDFYDTIDDVELYRHSQNVARLLDPSQCLSRLFVLPSVPLSNGNIKLRFLIVMAHQISDGLTFYNWAAHFISILNLSASQIEQDIERFRSPEAMAAKLPPAQEDLYPPISGSKARQRWFWAIMRVLRHLKKQLPPTILNPLRRDNRTLDTIMLPPVFDKVFDYGEAKKPPMNSFHIAPSLSKAASSKLISLCRSINVSIGAGCFALVGLSMMLLHERQFPDIPEADRPAFAASFPLNPRAFFGFTTPADSCMLAFSEGIVTPFLPSSLPVEGRFRLAAKIANRELKIYQKRLKSWEKGASESLDSHSPGRILANLYIAATERLEAKLPPHLKTGINPQGSLPAHVPSFGATCGVSSVGSNAQFFREGEYDLTAVDKHGKDFAADYRASRLGVRARDNEFLCACFTGWDGVVGFAVSYDGCAISEESAAQWADVVTTLLENRVGDSKL